MNAADLARLQLAQRAYRATEPSAAEVQRGVRRARLSLRRPKARRSWFSKALVMVVLAMGGLAYANPRGLSDFVSRSLVLGDTAAQGRAGKASGAFTSPPAPEKQTHPSRTGNPSPLGSADPAPSAPGPQPLQPPAVPPAQLDSAQLHATRPAPDARPKAGGAGAFPLGVAEPTHRGASVSSGASSAGDAKPSPTAPGPVSDWGRVGRALAQDDESQALSALTELSESADQRTRDKADMGRAQLFMANGNRDKACSIARALTHRGAGSRIERQAQALLKNCSR